MANMLVIFATQVVCCAVFYIRQRLGLGKIVWTMLIISATLIVCGAVFHTMIARVFVLGKSCEICWLFPPQLSFLLRCNDLCFGKIVWNILVTSDTLVACSAVLDTVIETWFLGDRMEPCIIIWNILVTFDTLVACSAVFDTVIEMCFLGDRME